MNTVTPTDHRTGSFSLHTNGFYHYTNGRESTFINPVHVMRMEYDDIGDYFLMITLIFTDGTARSYRLDGQTPDQAIAALLG